MEAKILDGGTLTFLLRDGEVLLSYKPERPEAMVRKIGEGCWNGYGGGYEGNETPEACAVREIAEESGGVVVKPEDLEKKAIVRFHNFNEEDKEFFVCKVLIFIARKWSGEPKDGDGMVNPTWFPINAIPYENMSPSDKDWIPHLFGNRMFVADSYLSKHQKEKLRETEIKFVDSLN